MNSLRSLAAAAVAVFFSPIAAAEVAAPPAKKIPGVLAEYGCTVFLKVVEAAGMSAKLGEDGPLTCFAPTDRAFESLSAGKLQELLDPARRAETAKWVASLVVEADASEEVLLRSRRIPTLSGEWITIWVSKGVIRLDNVAELSRKDLKAANGIVHLTDQFPPRITEDEQEPSVKGP